MTPNKSPRARNANASERLFLAITPDTAASRSLGQLDPWLNSLDEFRVIPGPLRHLTLLFLGETTPDEKDAIIPPMRAIAANADAFETPFSRVGALPNPRRTRIIAVFLDPESTVASLMRRMQADLKPLVASLHDDPRPTRDPLPHITLARLRSRRRPRAFDERAAPSPEGALRVERIELIRSRLSAQGPEYETVDRFSLRGDSDRT